MNGNENGELYTKLSPPLSTLLARHLERGHECTLQRLTLLLPVKLLFVTLAFVDPTEPLPRSTEKSNKFAVFPFPKLRFCAAWLSKLSRLKKCCKLFCAVTAESSCSCCKINKTATRAKSRTSSVTENVAVGSADTRLEAAEDVAEGVLSDEV